MQSAHLLVLHVANCQTTPFAVKLCDRPYTHCAIFRPDEGAEAGSSQREQRQQLGRQQRERDAQAQQEKIQKRKEKKERRQSLAANAAAPRLSHGAQIDAAALQLFPEQQTESKV